MEWKVFLTGDESDLNELSKSFCGPDLAIVREEDGFALQSSTFSEMDKSDAVREDAENILLLLNGAARLGLGTSKPIALAHIALIKDDGSKDYFLFRADTFHLRTSFSAALKHADGTEEQLNQADPVVGWVNAALGSETVARVLGLLATKPLDWVNLYRILEVVEQDVGGLEAIAERDWATRSALTRFKHTANSVSAAGDDARHGKERTKPPPDPMAPSEARSLIETILHNWLRAKQNP